MYEISEAEVRAVVKVIRSGKLMRDFGGQNTLSEQFEEMLSNYVGTKYAVAVNSGTSAIVCALVGADVGPGDEVIIPGYTFMATAVAPLAVGAVPVIAEVDETLHIDPADIEKKITPHTKAIIPVHMLGRPCNMQAIMKIARKHKIKVIEDAAQAVGGEYRGKKLNSIGHSGVYSFNWYKNISCGEGGAVLTSNLRAYERAMIYHDGGLLLYTSAGKMKEPIFAGVKLKFTEVQAAIIIEQLKKLDKIIGRLRKRADAMRDVFATASHLQPNPSNDVAGECGTTVPVIAESAKEALAIVKRAQQAGLGAARPYDTGKHVYWNWEPIIDQRGSHSEALNPYRLAGRKIECSPDMCPNTRDILARTANIVVPYKATVAQARSMAKQLIK